MCELNEKLRQLALEAREYPLKSARRQKVMSKLFREIKESGQICYPAPSSKALSGRLYQECCDVALQQILKYIYEKIELYKPEKEVLAWVNYLLKTRFIEAEREVRGRNFGEIRVPNLQELSPNPTDGLDPNFESVGNELNPYYQSQAEREEISRGFQEIREDSARILRETHVQGRPDANLQYIALKLNEGYSCTEIAVELNVPISTLHGLWRSKKYLLQNFF
ncbi:MAG: hypothetical protein SVX43_11290 [Cyanobacteriota bacterium]|nr:hypothetical protein [Cyanobacteriota bacterium]